MAKQTRSPKKLLKYPHIPAFSIERVKHPDHVKLAPPKKPVRGRILIMRGPSGSGKTTHSELLTDEFRGTKKKIKTFHLGYERRKRGLGFTAHDKQLLLTFLKKRIDAALKKYRLVIIDEVFNFREELEVVRENHPHSRILVISLETPMDVSIRRSSTRHRGKYYTPLKKRHIEGLWYIAHFVKCGRVLNTDDNIEDVFQKLLNLLKEQDYL